MKLQLKQIQHGTRVFEAFMSKDRHRILHKLLFTSCLRNLIYKGSIQSVLEETVEQCHTLEECVYMGMLIWEQQKLIDAMINEDEGLKVRVVLLGTSTPDAFIEEKEAFLREMEGIYKGAYQDAEDFINRNGGLG